MLSLLPLSSFFERSKQKQLGERPLSLVSIRRAHFLSLRARKRPEHTHTHIVISANLFIASVPLSAKYLSGSAGPSPPYRAEGGGKLGQPN